MPYVYHTLCHQKAVKARRAMVEATLGDFRVLDTVLHANLAERFLRESR